MKGFELGRLCGGGDLGFGERELERRGGGERALLASGVVSWYGAKSMVARCYGMGVIGRCEGCCYSRQQIEQLEVVGNASCGLIAHRNLI